jgi:hypothetical protein
MILVIDRTGKLLAPCRVEIAGKLLAAGDATIYQYYPLTIQLKRAVPEAVAPRSEWRDHHGPLTH